MVLGGNEFPRGGAVLSRVRIHAQQYMAIQHTTCGECTGQQFVLCRFPFLLSCVDLS
jgi:hypothetical protein